MTLLDDLLPKLEKIALSFDLPTLLHPVVIHFLMALPVVILFLELMNLIMKKKAVGGVSFFLILLTVLAAFASYATGLTDGQDAAFTDAAKTALGDHKLLGTYILLGSVLVLFLKLLAMMGSKLLKALYMFVLIGFIVVMVKQGNEGGELVYEHGLNVKQVKALDDKVFDLEEALEEEKEKVKMMLDKAAQVVVTPVVPTKVVEVIAGQVNPSEEPSAQEVSVPAHAVDAPSVMESTGIESESESSLSTSVTEEAAKTIPVEEVTVTAVAAEVATSSEVQVIEEHTQSLPVQ